MNTQTRCATIVVLLAGLFGSVARAQTPISENFTGTTTNNQWLFFDGACLTAGSNAVSGSIGQATTGGSGTVYTFPGCVAIASSYYNENLVGGVDGYLGSSSAPSTPSQGTPDPNGQGALRFTNGYPGGYAQHGSIVSASTFPTGAGIQVQFETLTYHGDSGGAGHDGADGMSFYLLDGCMPVTGGTVPSGCASNPIYGSSGSGITFPGIGAWGGSLAYTCSNANPPYDGLVGAYLGLGIDEFGNFLNGTNNTLGESGTSATGDNTASGGGYQPGRIGLRGAGSIAWQALTDAYGSNPGSSSLPYYPASLANTCSTGNCTCSNGTCSACPSGYSLNTTSNTCWECASGTTLYSPTNQCMSCPNGATYNSSNNTCTPVATCPNGATYSSGQCTPECQSGSYNSGTSLCDVCPNGYTFDTTHGTSSDPCAKCSSGGSYSASTGHCTPSGDSVHWTTPSSTSSPNEPTMNTPIGTAPTTSTPSTGVPYSLVAVQHTCSTGTLWNYSTPSSPTNAGAATLPTASGGNTGNTAGILDYTAIPNAYSVLSGVEIAAESASTRTLCSATVTSNCVTPIVYNLSITQNGLLSLSYSINGAATQQVIKNQSITASNGPLPSSFRFGFAGSTGGDTNIHEILCFKAQPNTLSSSSVGLNQVQSQELQTGTAAYFAFYDPNDWTGRLTANPLAVNSAGNVVIDAPIWDAACVLTGGNCASTGATGMTAEAPANRTVLSWNGSQGIPFEWSDLTTAQQNALDSGDPASETQPAYRLAYLRGDRTNEVSSSATCPDAALSPSQACLRARDDVLGDIVDSSPTWVGPPEYAFTGTWSDKLYPSATDLENAGTQNYAQYITAEETRENVVYVGSNDGLLHGFRAGAYNSGGTFNSTAPNDGEEVLAYIPNATIQGSVYGTASTVNTIHGTNPTNSNAVTANVDYSNPQYGHSFFIDATPGTGDLFYNGTWHTWVVSGMGAGGAGIFAIDASNPANFSESNAASLVVGEWSPGAITCANVANCGKNLGNTYGTPVIRRTHAQNASGDGMWAVMWGNGFNSNSGDAGLFVMLVDPSTEAQTIYYFSTGTHGSGNGIAYVTAVDLDGDHVADYVYAGDENGNIWRFDLTSSNPASWGTTRCLDAACATTSTKPLFSTASGQPITSQLVVTAGQTPAGANTLLIVFGTGQQFPLTNTTATSYQTGTQAIYGVWDWAMANWNSKSSIQYASLTPTGSGLAAPYTIQAPNPASPSTTELQEQVFTVDNSGCGSSGTASASCGDRDIAANATVCWMGSTACSSNDTQFGWFVYLPGGTSALPEQIIFNPNLIDGVFLVDSTIPPANTLLSCNSASATGYTYGLQVMSGGALPNLFPQYYDTSSSSASAANMAGVATDASGTPLVVTTSGGQSALVYQTLSTVNGSNGGTTNINLPPGTAGQRLTYIQVR
jgi:type IV pilus assembly protein PilY1